MDINRVCFALVALAATASAQIVPAPGFSSAAHAIGPPSRIAGGLVALPDRSLALFDGTAVVRVDASDGSTLATLFVPPSFVFGSFLALSPSGAFLLFGESSAGTLTRIPLDGSPAAIIATLPLNYDAVFDGEGFALVSAGNATFTATTIVRVDLATGVQDAIAQVPGASGPLAIDGDGRLLYGETSSVLPAPPGSGSVYAWSAAQVAGAIGPGALGPADAAPVVGSLGAVTDLEIDAEGDLWIADSAGGTLTQYAGDGTATLALECPGGSFTYLARLDAPSPPPYGGALLEPFQPPAGRALAAVASDFATFDDLVVVRPRRARFESTPAVPVPPGPFTVELRDGPPLGQCFLFIAAGAGTEHAVPVAGVPLYFALLPPTISFVAALPLDAAGGIALAATNPGVAGTIHVQGALTSVQGAILGTTEALALKLQ